jgi:hypothetical protein
VRADGTVEARDKTSGARLLILCQQDDHETEPVNAILEPNFSSNDYGHKEPSVSACWATKATLPFSTAYTLVPIAAGEDEKERMDKACRHAE